MILASVAMLVATIFGLILGIFSALYKDSIFDRTAMVVSVFGMSFASFFAAILVAWLFAYVLSAYTGLSMFGSLIYRRWFGRGEYIDLKNLILPAFTLAIRPLAIITELTRSSMLDVLSSGLHSGLPELRTFPIQDHCEARYEKCNESCCDCRFPGGSPHLWLVLYLLICLWLEGRWSRDCGCTRKIWFPVVMGAVLFISVTPII